MQNLLIIEDDAAIREALRFALELEGYSILAAANGLDGLEILQKEKPALIVLDLMMPVMDGWQFIEALKQDSSWSKIPLIAMTALTNAVEPDGVDAFIRKPLDLGSLLEIIKNLLSPNFMTKN